ncbi:hypothetical protein MUP35_02305, partial [Patescibacteria group bacterium]|nr:hypothetical protein [Patescibacteria group bacterium]
MKRILNAIILILLMVSIANCQNKPTDFPVLKGSYLGQKPPGMTPEIFAPGIISHPDYFEHSAAVFSPDGNEVYWSAKPNGQRYFKIYFMKMVDGIWSKPMVSGFCMGNISYESFTLSSNGEKIYFGNESKL